MFLGASSNIPLGALFLRIFLYNQLGKRIEAFMARTDITEVQRGTVREVVAVEDMSVLATKAMFCVQLLHFFLNILMTTFVLYGIDVTLYPEIDENVQRGYSRLWANAFLIMTSFSNSGFTLNSMNLVPYADKPGI